MEKSHSYFMGLFENATKLQKYEQSLQHLKSAISCLSEDDPSTLALYFKLAHLYYRVGMTHEAITLWSKLKTLSGEDKHCNDLIARAHLTGHNDPDTCLRFIKRNPTTTLEGLKLKAACFYQLGDMQMCQAECQEIIKKRMTCGGINDFYLGLRLMAEDKYEEAEEQWQRMLIKKEIGAQHEKEVYYYLGECTSRRGELKTAAEWYFEAISKDYRVVLKLISIYDEHQHYDYSLRCLQEAVRQHPLWQHGAYLLSQRYLKEEDISKAELYARQALDIDPYWPWCYELMANIAQEKGEHLNEVCSYMQHFLELSTDLKELDSSKYDQYHAVIINLSMKCQHLCEIIELKSQCMQQARQEANEQCIECFEQMIKIDPTFLMEMGSFYEEKGQLGKAEQSYEQLVKEKPLMIDAYKALLKLQRILNKDQQASTTMERAKQVSGFQSGWLEVHQFNSTMKVSPISDDEDNQTQ